MHQDIPVTCDGCGKSFFIEHALSFSKGSLVMAKHDDTEKYWDALGARALVPSDISYKTNRKSTVGQYRGRGPRPEWGRGV